MNLFPGAAMDPTINIRRLGFRRWYERELIRGHAALVTCFLCGLTVAVILEQINFEHFGWRPLGLLLLVFGAIALGWYSWRSYSTVLLRAEHYGQSSACPRCQAYGRFKVVASGIDTHPSPMAEAMAPLSLAWMRVECRKCGQAWRMPE